MEKEEFNCAYLLRLAPYSAPLNPIEECCSVFKLEIKKLNANGLQNLLSNPTPEGAAQTEHRLLYLENYIDLSMTKRGVITYKSISIIARHRRTSI